MKCVVEFKSKKDNVIETVIVAGEVSSDTTIKSIINIAILESEILPQNLMYLAMINDTVSIYKKRTDYMFSPEDKVNEYQYSLQVTGGKID